MSDLERRLLAYEVFCYDMAVKCYEANQIAKANGWADLGDAFRIRRMNRAST